MRELQNVAIFIESVQGVTPGLASQISYTCTLVFDDGSQKHGVPGIVPAGRRWPAPIKIDAAVPSGTVNPDGSVEAGLWPGYAMGPEGTQAISAFIDELPHVEPCK